ncbi:ALF repeat-containing protein [Streptomyces kronopolitis]
MLLCTSLAAGLLGAGPAAAAETDEDGLPLITDRGQVVAYWMNGGTGIKEAAEQALLGTDDDIKKFLEQRDRIEFDDDYVDASRLFNAGGPAVREAAKRDLVDAYGEATGHGRRERERIEAATDRLAGRLLHPLPETRAEEMLHALEPVVRRILAAEVLPFPNPIGLPHLDAPVPH